MPCPLPPDLQKADRSGRESASFWSHVGKMNVEYCQNPAHNFNLLRFIPSFEPDTHWCRMAGKYLTKSLGSFDEFIGKPELPVKSYSVIKDAFSEPDGQAMRKTPS